MSRDEGFAIADFSTSHHDDTKVKAMWRTLQDPVAMNAAMQLLEGVILSSWRDGKRVTAVDASPVWIVDVDTPTRHLVEAGLLDEATRIPLSTWKTWFGTAKKRRDASRERWRVSKQRQRLSTNVNGSDSLSPRGHNVETRAPSVPTVPTESKNGRDREGARGRRGPTRVGELLSGRGQEGDPAVTAGMQLLRDER